MLPKPIVARWTIAPGISLLEHKLRRGPCHCLIPSKDLPVPPLQSRGVATEDEMRIFERLRGRDRSGSNIERKLVETVVTDLLHRVDDEAPMIAVPEGKSTCCSPPCNG